MITFEKTGDFASARLTQKLEDCPDCGGTGLVRTTVTTNGRTYEVVGPCATRKLEGRVRVFNAARIPARYAEVSIESFKPEGLEQLRARELAKGFVYRWPAITKGFLFSGPVGTGKTHLLCATLKFLSLEHGVPTRYVEISNLYNDIRRGFQEGRSGGEIVMPLAQIEVLAIDEFGKGRVSQFELETLDELISRRYNAGRTTLFATNYEAVHPDEALKRTAVRNSSGTVTTADLLEGTRDSNLLNDRVGARIYSRVFEMCDIVNFPATTKDNRTQRNRAVERQS